jgi:coenzyme F420-reducing hydrogenase alpha subunit
METRTIVINPVTRIEGHGKVTIFLDEQGQVNVAAAPRVKQVQHLWGVGGGRRSVEIG